MKKSVRRSRKRSVKPRRSVKRSMRRSVKPRRSVKRSMRRSVKPRRSVKRSMRRSVKPRRSVKNYCKSKLQNKIKKNIEEYKKGRYSSVKQAVAVSYSQVRKLKRCKKI